MKMQPYSPLNLQMFAQGGESGEGCSQQSDEANAPASQNQAEGECHGGEVPQESAHEESTAKAPDEKGDSRQRDLNILRAVRDAFEEREKNARIESIVSSWESQAREMKETYPMFSLENEVNNPDFLALLKAGVPLRRAYEAANLDLIMASAIRYAYTLAGQKAVNGLLKTRERPCENGVLDRASSIRHTDVHSLSQKDIMRILGEVSRGAKISFN